MHRHQPSPAATVANPAPAGPGVAPGNAERTAPQSDPGAIGGGTIARPERYLVIARYLEDEPGESGAAEPRYLFARWVDWPYPAMLAISPPALDETLGDTVASVLSARLGVTLADPPRLGDTRVPARMPHPRTGVDGLGWLRPVAVAVRGELTPDALLDGFVLLVAREAREALPSDVERTVFDAGVALFD